MVVGRGVRVGVLGFDVRMYAVGRDHVGGAERGLAEPSRFCLASGHLSWAISVLTACWSQVVGSAYRDDQRLSVSPSSSLSSVSL